MTIIGFGVSCFRIESKEVTVVIDPPRSDAISSRPSPSSRRTSGLREEGVRIPRAHPDLLLITHDHPRHSNRAVSSPETFVISSPGEYEFQGIPITGIATFHDREGGKLLGRNTAYLIQLEGMRICHLGDLGDRKVLEENAKMTTIEAASAPCDILFIPCGGKTVLGPKEAAALVQAVRPKLAIPMHASSFTPFAAALGMKLETLERIAFRPSELPKEGTRLVALTPPAKARKAKRAEAD